MRYVEFVFKIGRFMEAIYSKSMPLIQDNLVMSIIRKFSGHTL